VGVVFPTDVGVRVGVNFVVVAVDVGKSTVSVAVGDPRLTVGVGVDVVSSVDVAV
jgi:RNase H-fold protein (predicted Holliday junction resolvase)